MTSLQEVSVPSNLRVVLAPTRQDLLHLPPCPLRKIISPAGLREFPELVGAIEREFCDRYPDFGGSSLLEVRPLTLELQLEGSVKGRRCFMLTVESPIGGLFAAYIDVAKMPGMTGNQLVRLFDRAESTTWAEGSEAPPCSAGSGIYAGTSGNDNSPLAELQSPHRIESGLGLSSEDRIAEVFLRFKEAFERTDGDFDGVISLGTEVLDFIGHGEPEEASFEVAEIGVLRDYVQVRMAVAYLNIGRKEEVGPLIDSVAMGIERRKHSLIGADIAGT